MKAKVLCVDDEPSLLDLLKNTLEDEYDIHTASNSIEALEVLEKQGPFSVIITDMRMPAMDGISFLENAQEISPHTVRIMLTGAVTQETTERAINEGHVFRFLSKPISPQDIIEECAAAAEAYEDIQKEHKLLSKTLTASLEVLTDTIALANPHIFKRCTQVRKSIERVSEYLGCENAWELKAAATIFQLGHLTIPEETLEKHYKADPLSPDEELMLKSHYSVTAKMISKIPKMEPVCAILQNLTTLPDNLSDVRTSNKPSLYAAIIHIADIFDRLILQGENKQDAINALRADPSTNNSIILNAFEAADLSSQNTVRKTLALKDLQEGMTLTDDVFKAENMLLVPKDKVMDSTTLQRLQNYFSSNTSKAFEVLTSEDAD